MWPTAAYPTNRDDGGDATACCTGLDSARRLRPRLRRGDEPAEWASSRLLPALSPHPAAGTHRCHCQGSRGTPPLPSLYQIRTAAPCSFPPHVTTVAKSSSTTLRLCRHSSSTPQPCQRRLLAGKVACLALASRQGLSAGDAVQARGVLAEIDPSRLQAAMRATIRPLDEVVRQRRVFHHRPPPPRRRHSAHCSDEG